MTSCVPGGCPEKGPSSPPAFLSVTYAGFWGVGPSVWNSPGVNTVWKNGGAHGSAVLSLSTTTGSRAVLNVSGSDVGRCGVVKAGRSWSCDETILGVWGIVWYRVVPGSPWSSVSVTGPWTYDPSSSLVDKISAFRVPVTGLNAPGGRVVNGAS